MYDLADVEENNRVTVGSVDGWKREASGLIALRGFMMREVGSIDKKEED